MVKIKCFVIVALFALASIVEAKTPAVSSTLTEGRFQIVNGVPEAFGTIMLLDTWTGDVWIVCKEAGQKEEYAANHWCYMPKDFLDSKEYGEIQNMKQQIKQKAEKGVNVGPTGKEK